MEFALLRLTVNGFITTQTRKVMNYYFSISDYIPATQLRGAILAEYYYQKGKIDHSFYTSPAFPSNSAPSHYFSYAEGRKSNEFVEEKGVLKLKGEELAKGKALSETLKLKEEEKPRIGVVITRKSVEKDRTRYVKFTAESFISMHVAIDKRLASSYHRMLFAYEYKKFDTLWALAQPSEVLDVVKGGTIRVGRGKNRGNYGVKVEVVKEVDLPEPKGLSYCLSQCIPSLLGRKFFEVKKDIEGIPIIIGDTSTYAGWFTNDKISGQKPSFKTLSEGTLIYVEDGKNFSDLLPAGLNFMFSIEDLNSLLERVGV